MPQVLHASWQSGLVPGRQCGDEKVSRGAILMRVDCWNSKFFPTREDGRRVGGFTYKDDFFCRIVKAAEVSAGFA